MNKNYYEDRYGMYGEIDLPMSHRTYFDAFCYEYSQYPIDQKLLDLGYVITHGFDIKKAVRDIMKNHQHVEEKAIRHAIWDLTAAACHTKSYDFSNRRNSLDTDIDILIEDFMRNYRLPLDGSGLHYIVENFRDVNEQEPYRLNGWEITADEVKENGMFNYDKFISYPGDFELIERYHIKDIELGDIGQIFPTGPCPEPWYGNPMTAKVIILGNMPQYDDFITRCSNLILKRDKELHEDVKSLVHRTMCLSGNSLYEEKWTDADDDIRVTDAYNSPLYRHWVTELKTLAFSIGADEQELLDSTCVINATAYYATGGEDPLAAGLLPSHYYLRSLINYRVHNHTNKPLFIIPSPSLHKVWKKILAWAETDIMVLGDKILIEYPNAKLSLSPKIIGKRNGKRILEKIR